MDFDAVAAHAEGAAPQIFAALVLDIDQAAEQSFAGGALARLEHDEHAVVGFGRAEAVDAGNRGYDDDVAALEEGSSGAHAQPVELFVDGRFLFDIGVGGGKIGFGLVVVVVADEIFDGVLRKEIAKFVEELRGQRFVVRQHQGRAVHGGNDLGHGEGFAGAGDAEQDLVFVAAFDAAHELADGRRLVAAGLVIAG